MADCYVLVIQANTTFDLDLLLYRAATSVASDIYEHVRPRY